MFARIAPAVIACTVLGGLAGAICSSAVPAQEAAAAAAELARGEHIARFVCADCHVVARDQEFPPLLRKPAPSFFEIANRPGVSAESLQHFITTTHWDNPDTLQLTMPALLATPEQARAVSRYILSLKGR